MSKKLDIIKSSNEIKTDKLRCWLEINLSFLKNNIEKIKSNISKNSDIIAVLKANCFGFGALYISKYLSSIGIKFFAVSTLKEALYLRKSGLSEGEILILSWTPIYEKETLIKYNLTQTLIDYEYAKKLNNLPNIVKCHIKIEAGMNRFDIKKLEEIINCYKFKNLKINGIFSELCRVRKFKEEVDNYTKIQINTFNYVLNELKRKGIDLGLSYLMNSIGILRFKDNNYDLVSVGFLMYGINPDQNNKEIDRLLKENNFKPIASLKCKIMTIKDIEKGQKVGYNGKYSSIHNEKIATISIGYADGLSFVSSKNGFKVYVKNNLFPIIGNICMDTTIIKISLSCNIKENDIVLLFGYSEDGKEYLNFKEFIDKSGSTIGEALSRLGQRITRIYHY